MVGEKKPKKPTTAMSKKPGKKTTGGKHKKSSYQSYGTYLHKVLKITHPEMRISRKAMSIMDSLMHDLFERLGAEAGKLATYQKKRTLTAKEMQVAVRLLVPGELSKHAVVEATKAVAKFNSAETPKKTPSPSKKKPAVHKPT